MSEIDWSKAPEGAMCYVHEFGFFKCEHGEWWVSQGLYGDAHRIAHLRISHGLAMLFGAERNGTAPACRLWGRCANCRELMA